MFYNKSIMRLNKTIFALLFPLLTTAAWAESAPNDAVSMKGHTYGEQDGSLPNFHQVHPYLYRGGQPTEAGLQKLSQMGVKTIFDLRNPGEKHFDESGLAQKMGIKCINLPMGPEAPSDKLINTVIGAIEKAKANPENGSVFVHCAHGSDRTGCLIGIWRVTHDNMSYDEAYKEMRKYYFGPKFTQLSGAVKKAADEASVNIRR